MADVATTFTALWLFPLYAAEVNPIMVRVVDAGPVPAIAIKIGLAAFCTLTLRFIRPPKTLHAAFVLGYSLAGIVPAINNAYIIIKIINGLKT